MKLKLETPYRLVFFGTPDFAVPALSKLLGDPAFNVCAVVTQPDRPAGRGNKLRMSPVKELALAHSIPVLQPENIRKNQENFITELRSLGEIHAAVVVSFGQILPKAVLEFPSAGCINIHASLLPRWRGAAPVQRAIMAGDNHSGVCLMRLETGLDTGPVYSRSEVAIEAHDHAGSLHDKLAETGAELLARDLSGIISGVLTPVPQAVDGVTMASKITNEEARINWNESADTLALRIRALSPFPGAFTLLNGKRLKIFRGVSKSARPGRNTSAAPVPGAVEMLDPGSIEVYCGSGMLALEEVQLDGKKRMSADDFARGAAIGSGTILGSE